MSKSWQYRGRTKKGQLFKLATAAVAGCLLVEALTESYNISTASRVQQVWHSQIACVVQSGRGVT